MFFKIIIPFALVLIWLILLKSLMIMDVWDETFFMVYIYHDIQSVAIWDKIFDIWTQPLGRGIYRPIPASIGTLILETTTFSPFAWQIMRGFNIIVLIASLGLFLATFQRWQIQSYFFSIFTLLFLFSGSSFIAATWYPNIFDVSSVFFLSLSLFLISYQYFIAAGIAIGLSFFCKEISLIIPLFLIILYFNQKLSRQAFFTTFSISIIFGAVYWIIRLQLIDLGSETDIHGFAFQQFIPSLIGWIDSLWWQNMQRDQAGILGITCTVLSLLAFKTHINRLLFLAMLILCAFIYWGLLATYQEGMLIHHLNFIGRLYLLPVTVLLIGLLLWGRPIIFALIAIPILWGGWQTYHGHKVFQESYFNIVQLAEQQEETLVVYYKYALTYDPIRNIRVGDYANASYILDMKTGKLIPNN